MVNKKYTLEHICSCVWNNLGPCLNQYIFINLIDKTISKEYTNINTSTIKFILKEIFANLALMTLQIHQVKIYTKTLVPYCSF